jgi:hypothetical protein
MDNNETETGPLLADATPVCVRCNKAVVRYAARYETFERMHWLCFHLEFEHTDAADADTACRGGPWGCHVTDGITGSALPDSAA